VFINPSSRDRNDFVHATNELVPVTVGKLKLTIGVFRLGVGFSPGADTA